MQVRKGSGVPSHLVAIVQMLRPMDPNLWEGKFQTRGRKVVSVLPVLLLFD